MGIPSDIDELSKAKSDKRSRVLWSLGTVLFTVVCTTGSVSWKMRGFIADLEQANRDLRGDIRVIAKELESLQSEQKETRAELKYVRDRADSALLFAQMKKVTP